MARRKKSIFTQKDIRMISHLTDINAHTEARIVIARKLKSKKLKRYQTIKKLQNKQGFLTIEQSNKRLKIDQMLFKELRRKVSKQEANAVEGAL